jgi:hypothetical protein
MLRAGSVDSEVGTGCESCHGRAEKWLDPHSSGQWAELAPSQRQDMGFQMHLSLSVRVCLDCHVGGADNDVNHDLIAAGHPWLKFEPSAHFKRLPRHWGVSKAGSLLDEKWVISRVMTAEVALKLLKYRAEAPQQPRPEFAEYDCRGCHSNLGRPSRQSPSALRGIPAWNLWYDPTLNVRGAPDFRLAGLTEGAIPKGLSNLRYLMEKANPDRVLVAARSWDVAGQLNLFLRKNAPKPMDRWEWMKLRFPNRE